MAAQDNTSSVATRAWYGRIVREPPLAHGSRHKNDLARAMVAQSEQAFLALAQGKGSAAPAVKTLEYKEMAPFFVAGDRDAP